MLCVYCILKKLHFSLTNENSKALEKRMNARLSDRRDGGGGENIIKWLQIYFELMMKWKTYIS